MDRNDKNSDWPLLVLQACRQIESTRENLTLEALAGRLGVEKSRLQRQFTRRLGISPRAYVRALCLFRLARDAVQADTALEAVMNAGFDSPSTGYAASAQALGTTPGQLRGRIELDAWLGLSELGWMLMAATGRGICWLAFGDDPARMRTDLQNAFPEARIAENEPRLRGWFEQVREFILLPRAALDMPMDIRGTAFQAGVWQALKTIPLGQTRSYSEVARVIGRPKAVRAVASACGCNQVALLIPCHRVIAADGGLAGYRWGTQRKCELLEREKHCNSDR